MGRAATTAGPMNVSRNLYGYYVFHNWRGPNSSASGAQTDRWRDPDPYLLVLLAEQEIEADRPEQAASLIDAAYAAYDQCRFGS